MDLAKYRKGCQSSNIRTSRLADEKLFYHFKINLILVYNTEGQSAMKIYFHQGSKITQ